MESLNNNIFIRLGDITDLELIVLNNIKMAQETENKKLSQSTIHPGVEELLHDSSLGWYYLAEIKNEIAGQLMITREWSDWRNGYFWRIQSVFVQKEYRKQRVYSSLHQHVIKRAKIMGAVGLRLYVDAQNKNARNIYEQLGMKNSNYLFYEEDWSE